MTPLNYTSARKDHKLAVLEGFHAVKHAIRFGAEILDMITPDKGELIALANKIAADVSDEFTEARELDQDEFNGSTPYPIHSGLIAIAKRKNYSPDAIDSTEKLVIWLDNPKNHENVGAVIRLAAGMGVGAVAVSGDIDVWNPGVLRGSAGLHYALPVIKVDSKPSDFNKPVFAFDDKGEDVNSARIPQDSILVFGSERSGVEAQTIDKAEAIVSLPMRDGVSSYNLATSVAMGVFAIKNS